MPIVQRIRLTLMFALFALAYGTGMKILFELSVASVFIVTLILIVGTAIALKKVKRAARIEGSKPYTNETKDPTLLGMIVSIGVSGFIVIALMIAAQISTVLFVAAMELIVFGFMIAVGLIFVFGRIEIQTRDELTAKTA